MWGCVRKKEKRKEGNRGQRSRGKEAEEVTLAGNSGGGGRSKEPRIDEDSDGS